MKAAETATSSFLQHLHTVSGFFLIKLRDAATSLAGGLLWGGAFGTHQEEEDDLEAGPPPEAAADLETNVVKFLFNRAVGSPISEKALSIMPTFPDNVCVTLPCLLCLAQIRWQVEPHGFPSPTLHKWYTVCVTSLLAELVASIAQWFISPAAGGANPTSVYTIITGSGRIACYFIFMGHRGFRKLHKSCSRKLCMPIFGTSVMVVMFVWNEIVCALQLYSKVNATTKVSINCQRFFSKRFPEKTAYNQATRIFVHD